MKKCCCKLFDMRRRKFDINCWNLMGLVSCLLITNTAAQHPNEPFGITLECTYRMSTIPWPILGEIYECYIEKDLFITHSKMPIKDASGGHKPWKTDEKVVGFYARSAQVHYFPNGLEKIFPNLRLIAIAMSNLKEIRQHNLIPFDQLQYLCLFDNDIETIEKHLFAYNLMLEAIDLRENRIVKINVNVFDYLINLRILHLSDAFNGSCVSSDASNRDAVVKLIQDIKEDCNERAIWRLLQSEKGAAKSIQLAVTEGIVRGEDEEGQDEREEVKSGAASWTGKGEVFWLAFLLCIFLNN